MGAETADSVTSVAARKLPEADQTDRFAQSCRYGEPQEEGTTAADAARWNSSLEHQIGMHGDQRSRKR